MEKGNWIKRHPVWTGVIGIFGLFFLVSLVVDTGTQEINKKVNDLPKDDVVDEQILEQRYLEFIINLNSDLMDMTKVVVDISYAGTNQEITLNDAGMLYDKSGDVYRNCLIKLDSMYVPDKFKSVHKHYRNSVVYLIEAMDLCSKGCYTNNPNLMVMGTDKINLANLELEFAVFDMEQLV